MRVRRLAVPALIAAAGSALLAGCSSTSSPAAGSASSLTIVVSAPVSTQPWVARFMQNGAQLAATQLNKAGVKVGGVTDKVVVKVIDNAGSAASVVEAAHTAVSDNAAALFIDGVGAQAAEAVAAPAHLPVFVLFDGSAAAVPASSPNAFRLAPADHALVLRLTDYLASSSPKLGVITDTSDYGRGGAAALTPAIARDQLRVVSTVTLPADASDAATQVVAARAAGATALVVWAQAPIVAAVVNDARSAGWNVPIWAGPTGEDPLVRQRLAAHPDWLDGVGFASFRITAEVGPAPFAAYRAAYVAAYGEDKIGVTQGRKPVVQPPDWSMFPYDATRLVAAAATAGGGVGGPLLNALNASVVVTGANGDERGYSGGNHEGVSPDDMYFAVFHGFVFAPVTNDPLSTSLPSVPQTG